jgi:hypothetical protein
VLGHARSPPLNSAEASLQPRIPTLRTLRPVRNALAGRDVALAGCHTHVIEGPFIDWAFDRIAQLPSLAVGVGPEPGTWTLTASGWVGAVVTPDLEVLVRPKVPLGNLFLLLDVGLPPDAWRQETPLVWSKKGACRSSTGVPLSLGAPWSRTSGRATFEAAEPPNVYSRRPSPPQSWRPARLREAEYHGDGGHADGSRHARRPVRPHTARGHTWYVGARARGYVAPARMDVHSAGGARKHDGDPGEPGGGGPAGGAVGLRPAR